MDDNSRDTLMAHALRILVIDDDPVMRELLEALLSLAGHTVSAVESGEAAMVHLRRDPLDVVLTDLHMPGLQGAELARELQAIRSPGTLLIGMSGSSPSRSEMRLLDYFVQKPFTMEQFLDAVEGARARALNGCGSGQASAPEVASASLAAAAPVLDEDVFARLAGTVPAVQLRELYQMTLDDIQSRLERMEESLRTGNVAALRSEAHAIKGSCGMVGATELYQLASTTERGTDAGSFPLADFAPACERLKRMLDGRLSPAS